jgi:hypothetical protein
LTPWHSKQRGSNNPGDTFRHILRGMRSVRRFYFQPAQRRISFACIAVVAAIGKIAGVIHSPIWLVVGWLVLAAALWLPTTVVSVSGLRIAYRGYRLIRWRDVREIREPGVWASMPTAVLRSDRIIKLVGAPPKDTAHLDELRIEQAGTA